jgi:hypothetical protein
MIDDGAVGGSQILDGPTAGGGIGVDARMVGGNEFIIQHHGVRSGTAKCDGVAGQRDGTTGKGAIDNDQQSWFGIGCGACRRGCGGYGRRRFDGLARGTLLTTMSPRLARAERFDIPVQRTYRTGHEDPKQYEKPVLEDRKR